MIKPNSLHRTERLRTLGAIRRLFDSGEGGFVYPLRYVWFSEPDVSTSAEVLFSVPKKFHRRANKRNTLKRRVKESYRLQKSIILNVEGAPAQAYDIALVYSTKEVHSYKTIDNAVRKILQQIAARN